MNTPKATRNARTKTKDTQKAQTARKRAPRKDERSSMGPGDLTPPSSGSQREDEVPQMLMSPPPEETLRVTRSKHASDVRSSSVGPSTDIGSSAVKPKRKRNDSNARAGTSQPSDALQENAVATSSRVTLEATPNPKPRKQSKLHVSFAEDPTTPTKASSKSPRSRASASPSKRSLAASPHASNPNADYLPPSFTTRKEQSLSPSKSRRRSVTPLPLYEPPPDRFTPPREVVYTPLPSVSKSSKRKTVPRSHGKSRRLTLQIKKEPPDIDFSAPLPPASPTDDPLLLYGPPPSTKPRPQAPRASFTSTHSRDTPPISSSSPVRPSAQDDSHLPNLDFANMDVDSDDDNEPLPPLFEFDRLDNNLDEAWTDDEQDNNESEFDVGEYTGKFKAFTVPTKADPPSSATRVRQDRWGRPISPFPYGKRHPSDAARRHSPIPESPVQEDVELPIAEYDDEPEAGPSGVVRSPTPPARVSPLPEDDADVPMEEPEENIHSSPTAASDQRPSDPMEDPMDEDDAEMLHPEGAGDGSFSASASEGEVAASAEAYVEFSVRILSSEGGSEPAAEPQSEDEPQDEHVDDAQPEDEATQDLQSELSYVDPEDIAPSVETTPPDEAHFEPERVAVQESHEVQRELSPEPVQSEPLVMEDRPEKLMDSVPELESIDSTAVVDPALKPQEVAPSPEPPSMQAPSVETVLPAVQTSVEEPTYFEHSEWSFSVPQSDHDHDEEMTMAEEEDAASVVRELSREPDAFEPRHAPLTPPAAPPPPTMATSPQNPFHVQTPGVGKTTGRLSDVPVADFRKQKAVLQAPTAPAAQSAEPEDELDDALLDSSIVKITSSDPMAAARAAAILRLHKYDCVENIPSPKRRAPTDVESTIKSARRKSVLRSGVGKGAARRSTLGGVLGNTVIIDGTPRTTLAELLKEAEATVIMEESSLHHLSPPKARASGVFKTPARTPGGSARFQELRSTFETPNRSSGPREWSKADWKLLDTCYTDERVALGQVSGLGEGVLAPAEDVEMEKVVDRFLAQVGAKVVDSWGPAWTRESLLKRARALQRKQMAGKHAPPSRASASVADSTWTPAQPQYSMLMSPNASTLDPNMSILGDLASTHPSSEAVAALSAPSADVRYAELLDEALAVEKDAADVPAPKSAEMETPIRNEPSRSFISPLLPGPAASSLASKLKGIVFSYLPRSPKPSQPKTKLKPVPAVNGPVLPVPPSEVFKKPRPPITTPTPKAAPKPAPPKDLVQLHPVPPPKPSMIPCPAQKTQTWVQLNPVPSRPSSSTGFNADGVRARRDSGASVKDLVKSFESMEKMQVAEREAERKLELRRSQSVKKWADSRIPKASKPGWRP